MAAKYNVVAKISSEDGSDIISWVTIGYAVDGRTGGISAKIQALPVSKDWDGWIYIKEKTTEEQEAKESRRKRIPKQYRDDRDNPSDDIPF